MNLSKTADASAEGGYRYGAFILRPESVSEDGNTAEVSAVNAESGRALGKVGSLRYPVCPGPFEAELPGSSVGGSGEEGPGAGEGGSAGGSGSGGEGNGSGSGGGDAPVYGSLTGRGGKI